MYLLHLNSNDKYLKRLYSSKNTSPFPHTQTFYLCQKKSHMWRRRQEGTEREGTTSVVCSTLCFVEYIRSMGISLRIKINFSLKTSPWNVNRKVCYLMSQRFSEYRHTFILAVHISFWYFRSYTRWQKAFIHDDFSYMCRHMLPNCLYRRVLLIASLPGSISNKAHQLTFVYYATVSIWQFFISFPNTQATVGFILNLSDEGLMFRDLFRIVFHFKYAIKYFTTPLTFIKRQISWTARIRIIDDRMLLWIKKHVRHEST